MLSRTIIHWALCLGLSACGEDAPLGSETSSDPDATDGETTSKPKGSCKTATTSCDKFGNARPARLSEHSAVYDPDRQEMVVFGGTPTIPIECTFGGKTEYRNETWIYSDACKGWQQVAGDGPQASGRHMAAWAKGEMWVLGGRFRPVDAASGAYTLYADLHRFNVKSRSWATQAVKGATPTARSNGALVYDPSRERLWLFAGNTSTDGASYEPLNDLYSYDLETSRWTEHSISAAPSRRLFHSMTYDKKRDRLVVYGGTDENAFAGDVTYADELLALDLKSLSWTQLKAGKNRPQGRFWASIVYDEADDSYVLFGGHDDTTLGNRNDTWRYDAANKEWRQLSAGDTLQTPQRGFCDFPPDFAKVDDSVPERRNAHTFVWSDACAQGLLFGGKTDCGSTDDVWRLSGDTWQKRNAATEGEACLRWRDDPESCRDVCF